MQGRLLQVMTPGVSQHLFMAACFELQIVQQSLGLMLTLCVTLRKILRKTRSDSLLLTYTKNEHEKKRRDVQRNWERVGDLGKIGEFYLC